MKLTQEQLTKAKATKSAEELIALAKENGLELTEEEAKNYFAELNKEGALADDELDNVSGGCGGKGEEMAPTEPPYESKYKVGDTVWYNLDWHIVSAVWWDGSVWKYNIIRNTARVGYATIHDVPEHDLLDHVPKKYM